jgi:hypothetical protein
MTVMQSVLSWVFVWFVGSVVALFFLTPACTTWLGNFIVDFVYHKLLPIILAALSGEVCPTPFVCAQTRTTTFGNCSCLLPLL